MGKLITGIHHLTALASNAQRNVDFYAGILGLWLVKKPLTLMLGIFIICKDTLSAFTYGSISIKSL